LAAEVLNRYATKIGEFTLIPSSGGVFELTFNGELLFSKKELGRFPDEGEILRLLEGRIP
jgi:selenoprotein W-related protein